MKVQFVNEVYPVNPLHPNAWRGERSVTLKGAKRHYRLRWVVARRENDWQHFDSAVSYNISPRWAKWFHVCAYGIGGVSPIRHFTIGHLNFSIISARLA